MKKSLSLPKALGLSVLLLGLTGCGDVVGDIQRGLEQAGKEFVFDNLKSQAEKNDGTAELLQPGKEFTLEITEGPIKGTKVVIPENALPSGVTEAVVAAYHLSSFELRDDTEYALQGPAVQIQLQNLTTNHVGDSIDLEEDAIVTIPYSNEDGDVDLFLGRLSESETVSQNWEIFANATTDQENAHITAETKSLGSKMPFPFAVLSDAVDEAVLTYSWKATNTTDGSILCEGSVIESIAVETLIADATSSTFNVVIQGEGNDGYTLNLDYNTHADNVPHAEITDVYQDLSCGAAGYTSTFTPDEEDFTAVLTDWNTTDKVEGQCGNDNTPCSILTGTSHFEFASTYSGGDDIEVTVTLTGVVSGVIWEEPTTVD